MNAFNLKYQVHSADVSIKFADYRFLQFNKRIIKQYLTFARSDSEEASVYEGENNDYSHSPSQANREILPLYIKACFTPTFLPVRILVVSRRHSRKDPRYYAWQADRTHPRILSEQWSRVTAQWKTHFAEAEAKIRKTKSAKFHISRVTNYYIIYQFVADCKFERFM